MLASILSEAFKENLGDTVFFLGGLAAIIGAIGVIWTKIIKPVVKAARMLGDRWEAIPDHDEMLNQLTNDVGSIKKDLEPTNGDKSSMSSRLDSVKHTVNGLKDDMVLTRDRIFENTRRLNHVEGLLALVIERQNAHRKLTAQLARATNTNAGATTENITRLSRWMKNFEDFDPPELQMPTIIPEETIIELGENGEKHRRPPTA